MGMACSRCRLASDTLATGAETRTTVWGGFTLQTGRSKRSGRFKLILTILFIDWPAFGQGVWRADELVEQADASDAVSRAEKASEEAKAAAKVAEGKSSEALDAAELARQAQGNC
jgi:hypothetical protein